MKQPNGYEDYVTAMVTTGKTPTINPILTGNEDPPKSDGHAETIERSLREYCIQSKRDLADVNRLIRIHDIIHFPDVPSTSTSVVQNKRDQSVDQVTNGKCLLQ
ncbi:hypothetical protein FGIG_00052 [Fasciola gigantica]|uniref:Uncharacterized protein n=1 Tax=Fasciola gigantica TaxID=46835 RepID=A0A504YJF2_FASGI|nr:hypothetical protein FGIG_00052 [Fasciola gigantica]